MNDNPYESGKEPHGDVKAKPAVPLIARLAIYGAIIALLVALMLPAVRSSREPARRNSCLNNMKQITLALLKYESVHGEFPPAYTVDADGNRLHSWRTLILPYIEGSTVYKSIDLTKPWDDPANAEVRELVMHEYLCPSSSEEDEHLTHYLAVVDQEGAFAGAVGRKIDEFKVDGTSNTIVIIEVSRDKAVHWMSPHDVDIDEIVSRDPEARYNHGSGFIAAFADGHADFIDSEIEPENMRALLTIAGGEELDE